MNSHTSAEDPSVQDTPNDFLNAFSQIFGDELYALSGSTVSSEDVTALRGVIAAVEAAFPAVLGPANAATLASADATSTEHLGDLPGWVVTSSNHRDWIDSLHASLSKEMARKR